MGLVDDDVCKEAACVELLERRAQLLARCELLGLQVQEAQERTAASMQLEIHFIRSFERLVARELVCLDVHRMQPSYLFINDREIKQQKNKTKTNDY